LPERDIAPECIRNNQVGHEHFESDPGMARRGIYLIMASKSAPWIVSPADINLGVTFLALYRWWEIQCSFVHATNEKVEIGQNLVRIGVVRSIFVDTIGLALPTPWQRSGFFGPAGQSIDH